MTASDVRLIQEFGQRISKCVERMANVVILAAMMLPPDTQRQLLGAVTEISEDLSRLLDSITPTEGLDA